MTKTVPLKTLNVYVILLVISFVFTISGMAYMFYHVLNRPPGMQFFYLSIMGLLLIPNAAYFFYHRKNGVFRWLMFSALIAPAIFRGINPLISGIDMDWVIIFYLVVLGVANLFTYYNQRKALLNP